MRVMCQSFGNHHEKQNIPTHVSTPLTPPANHVSTNAHRPCQQAQLEVPTIHLYIYIYTVYMYIYIYIRPM